MQIEKNYSLLNHNTFRMDVKSRLFIEYADKQDLMDYIKSNALQDEKFLHIGAGSNLLFTGDYDGVILHSGISFIERIKEDDQYVWLKAGSGVQWDDLCLYAAENDLGGIENLSYIPGEVGASAVQNIGAYGVEVADVISTIETVEIATGKERIFDVSECNYGYRDSIFKKEYKNKYIVTAVVYRLTKTDSFKLDYGNLKQRLGDSPITIASVRNAVIDIRKEKLPDPAEYGNAGSFFMNPVVSKEVFDELIGRYPAMPHYVIDADSVKIPAGWLIEQSGYKGFQYGGAAVHDKQCLVLINKDNATADDVRGLADMICQTVLDKFNISIHPEVNYIV